MNDHIETFLVRLKESSPYDVRVTKQLVAEARDHVRSAYETHRAAGVGDDRAQELAIRSFGDLSEYFARFHEEGGPTYQENNIRTTIFRIILGALIGALMTSFGLIDTGAGGISLSGGNEWTPIVTGGGAILGAALFVTPLVRRYMAVPLGGAIGLVVAMLLRDTIQLRPLFGAGNPVPLKDLTDLRDFGRYEPPSDAFIIGLIFGLIALGAAAGLILQITVRKRRAFRPTFEPAAEDQRS